VVVVDRKKANDHENLTGP